MLYITNARDLKFQWHIGERAPTVLDVVHIQADGDELDLITGAGVNLPRTNGVVQVWRAPWAQWIYDNIIEPAGTPMIRRARR